MGLGHRLVLISCVALGGCSTPSGPTSAPRQDESARSLLKLTQVEFGERFSRLPIPAPVSRIEYLYGLPHDKDLLADQKTPAFLLYRCRDGDMWISFGATEGTYGALACHQGTPTEADRNAARDSADRGACEAQEENLRRTIEQKTRRLASIQERLIENRDRIVALRDEQAAFAEAQRTFLQENLTRHRETERQRLLKTCPPLTPAAKVDEELKHRNIRLQTLFRDELQAFNTGLSERQRDADDKVRVMRQSLDRGAKEAAQLLAELKELRGKQTEPTSDPPTQEAPAQPDESAAQARWQAVARGVQELQAPVLKAEDVREGE
jgi:hypothetical protein